MSLETKIAQAKAKLLVEYPYFGTLASRLEFVVNDDLESFKSDGAKVEFRQEYLLELELSEVEFILANGAMHRVLAHQNRKNRRSGWLWQMATDIAINDMLLQNGMHMPYGAQYRKRFEGMYAEEIYEELKSDILRDDELEYEADEPDDVQTQQNKEEKKEQSSVSTQEELLTQQLIAEEAKQLLASLKDSGEELPKSLERFFKITEDAKLDWRMLLQEAIDRFFRDDYRLMPPSKKLLYEGVYLPSNTSEHFRLCIAVDTSASVDTQLLNIFLSEVSFIMEAVKNYTIELLLCDDKIHTHKSFVSGEPLELSLKGEGATDFRPVFQYVQEYLDDVKLLLYFTDLEGFFPKDAPPYPCYWVVPREKDVPFGSLVILED
jgi:predicted metal-dependent peptidase